MNDPSTMKQQTVQEQLSICAQQIHKLLNELPQHPAVTDTLDYTLGAIYGLYQADVTGFKNRSTAYVPEYHPHVANYARNLAEGRCLDSVWTAGFFFNSGIQRLAAVFDRIPTMLGAKPTKKVGAERKPTTAKDRMSAVNSAPHRQWAKVYDEVNTFKHSPTGRAAGRTVTMDNAVSACSEVLDLLLRSKATIKRNFPEPQLPEVREQ